MQLGRVRNRDQPVGFGFGQAWISPNPPQRKVYIYSVQFTAVDLACSSSNIQECAAALSLCVCVLCSPFLHPTAVSECVGAGELIAHLCKGSRANNILPLRPKVLLRLM